MKKPENLARLLVIIGLIFIFSIPLVGRLFEPSGTLEMHARMSESGGWSPAEVQARAGVPLRLRLTSDDVVHGFAIGQSDMPAVDVQPGKITNVTVTFDKPGKYMYYCTRWCGPNHWRMRGTIEVTGDTPAVRSTVVPPLYQTLQLDIDAPHVADVIPTRMPDADVPADIEKLLPVRFREASYYQSHSPSQVFEELRTELALKPLTDAVIWDLVAYIWRSNTTPEGLAEGQTLFASNCAACHGEKGGGDGVFVGYVKDHFGKEPADLSDPLTMLGASPALLQGKMLRGGMGTGMPYWGSVLTDTQTWELVSYLYSFQFKEMGRGE